MSFINTLLEKAKTISKPSLIIYPIVIIIAIPFLLVVGTVKNLDSFNRDVNFLLRHQALNIGNTIKPVLLNTIEKQEDVPLVLSSIVSENKELVSATILEKQDKEFKIYASSDSSLSVEEVAPDTLNRLAESLDQAFAGLTYDPNLASNVWVVTIPLATVSEKPLILALRLTTTTVNEILARTSKDSFVILSVLVLITLALLVNHFIFYKKALKAQQLEEVDRLKDEFISVASHELRAPVTAVVGYLDLLKEKIPNEIQPQLTQEFTTLNALTDDLNNLIEDLLEVSRIEQGRIKITPEVVDVNQTITTVVSKLAPLAQQKSLSLSYQQTTIPKITTDAKRLSQILTNLVNNSIKYTLKGQVTITATVKRTEIEIGVKDSGIGIPPQEMQKLFSKFHRVKDEKTLAVRGTGLGLWITKQLVEALGGQIFVESIYGSGSVFTFTLPLTGR